MICMYIYSKEWHSFGANAKESSEQTDARIHMCAAKAWRPFSCMESGSFILILSPRKDLLVWLQDISTKCYILLFLRWSIKGHSPPSNSIFASLDHAVSFKVIQNMFLCFFKFRPSKLIKAVWFSSPYSTSFRIMSLMMYYIFEIPIRARWARHAYFCRLGLPLHSHITSVLSSLTWLSHSLITETASLPLHVAMALSRIMPHI